MDSPIRVLIVDDSPSIRKILTKALHNKNGIQVIGEAEDPYRARELLVSLKPDVMTLDVEMPKMDGLTFLQKVMAYLPIPTIVVSSTTTRGSQNALKALELGAIGVVAKSDKDNTGEAVIEELIRLIHVGSKIDINSFCSKISKQKSFEPTVINKNITTNNIRVIAIASSTGGVEALRATLPQFPENSPPILVVQHMPSTFTKSLADSLNSICACEVKEAEEGDVVKPGRILLAPGNYHLLMQGIVGKYSVTLKQGAPVCYQRPAADVLFQSVANVAGRNAIGVVLTGMGSDGTNGAIAMKQNGAKIIAQDEESSIVYGMPRSVFEAGVVDIVAALNIIPRKVLELC